MGKPAVTIELSDEQRAELEGFVRRCQMARRAEIVLLVAEGLQNKMIVARLGKDAKTVGKWRRRFAELGFDGLYDEPMPRTPRKIGDDDIAETNGKTLEETPVDATHWSLRSMAEVTGYAPSTIHRIWQAFGLQLHRSETFELSTNPLRPDCRRLQSSRRCGTSSASISIRPRAPWSCVWTRKARCKRLLNPSSSTGEAGAGRMAYP